MRASWPGASIVDQLQVATGRATTAELSQLLVEIARALARINWENVPFQEYAALRGVIVAFLCGVGRGRDAEWHRAFHEAVDRLGRAGPPQLSDAFQRVIQWIIPYGVRSLPVDRRIVVALDEVAKECCRHMTVETVARHLGVSRWHLARILKRSTGASFTSHLRNARMTVASSLLSRPSLTIKEVAAKTGYGNRGSFHRDFKRCFGCTPKAWSQGRRPDS